MERGLRYAGRAKARDVLHAAAFGAAPGFFVWMPFKEDVPGFGVFHVLASWAFFTGLAVFVLASVRWGRRGRIDDRGLAVAAGPRGPGVELAWEEVEDLFLLKHGGVEARGQGRVVRLDWTLDAAAVAPAVRKRCHATIQARLLERIRAGESAVLPGPWTRSVGWAGLALIVLAAASPLALFVRLLSIGRPVTGCAVPALLWLAGMSLLMMRSVVGLMTSVEATADGLRVVRGWRGPLRRWPGIAAVVQRSDGGARVILESGAEDRIPPTVANLDVLPALFTRLKFPA